MKDIYGTALLYSGGLLNDIHAKTAHGLLRYSDRFRILGLIDQQYSGSMTDDHVEHCKENLVIFNDLPSALEGLTEKPKYLVMGVAFGGGMLPEEHRSIVKDALSQGMDVVCGLHQLLSEDSELAAIAEKNGTKIHDKSVKIDKNGALGVLGRILGAFGAPGRVSQVDLSVRVMETDGNQPGIKSSRRSKSI